MAEKAAALCSHRPNKYIVSRRSLLDRNVDVRLYLILTGSSLLLLLLLANFQALRYELHVASNEDEFHAKFNDWICDSRGTDVCSKAGSYDKVLGMLGPTGNRTSRAETSARAWDYCRKNLLRSGESLTTWIRAT
ncbi:hypothetical protein PHYSODRAFT_303055 [Phytophthora sojae]|uniref:Uncharacterized protein n=1 Tax=Phytophthora sojae (strain P6497) TaxID=1094619 RepID=G4ZUN8_PHYSP|nr:hypothetical protein PHYSODRAFT_303055 [Phytophthora sojae]EGZ13512.1 hypothetical protein PHYSODRAFT_303055 [Phytophthora sojae]|eukprot:XP_009530941.1 hypothetical protein PHYSODRAFT_303055 [Phytophthora sojae]